MIYIAISYTDSAEISDVKLNICVWFRTYLGGDIPRDIPQAWAKCFSQRASYSAIFISRIGPSPSSTFGWVPSGCPAGVAGLCRGLRSAYVALYV
jgi:hypothetical protein